MYRPTSPPVRGSSILITSAPRSARCTDPNGPAPYCSTATMVMSSSGLTLTLSIHWLDRETGDDADRGRSGPDRKPRSLPAVGGRTGLRTCGRRRLAVLLDDDGVAVDLEHGVRPGELVDDDQCARRVVLFREHLRSRFVDLGEVLVAERGRHEDAHADDVVEGRAGFGEGGTEVPQHLPRLLLDVAGGDDHVLVPLRRGAAGAVDEAKLLGLDDDGAGVHQLRHLRTFEVVPPLADVCIDDALGRHSPSFSDGERTVLALARDVRAGPSRCIHPR